MKHFLNRAKMAIATILMVAMPTFAEELASDYTSAIYNFVDPDNPSIYLYGYEMHVDWNEDFSVAQKISAIHQRTYETLLWAENVPLVNCMLVFEYKGHEITVVFFDNKATVIKDDWELVLKPIELAKHCNFDAVDLGLSVQWATYNVGTYNATDLGVAESWENFVSSNYDVLYTAPWRLPTENEIEEMREKCQIQYVEDGSLAIFIITGPNGNQIVLPATLATELDEKEGWWLSWYDINYWTSTPEGDKAVILLNGEGHFGIGTLPLTAKCHARLVRP